MAVFRKDPCGIMCLLVTYALVVYGDYSLISHIIQPALSESLWGAFHAVILNVLLFLLVFSHFKASYSDPGSVPLPKTSLDFSDVKQSQLKSSNHSSDKWSVCNKCQAYRPPRAHHCRVCGRCIKKMDHHCPWINNCVGESNQKYFILFLMYTGVCALYGLSLIIASMFLPCVDCTQDYVLKTRVVHKAILMVICILFFLFSTCIMYDQCYSILYDMTAVEQVQLLSKKARNAKMELLSDIFGYGSYLSWLSPFSEPKFMDQSLNQYVV